MPKPAPNPVDINLPSVDLSQITVFQALKALKVGYWAPWVLLIGYVAFNGLNNRYPVQPVNPNVPVAPVQKTLKDRVSPEAAVELGNFYHSLAAGIYFDGKAVDSTKKSPRLSEVGQVLLLHKISMESFQSTKNITGIAGINEPIKAKFKRATGSLSLSAKIDDPATNVRASVVAICKEISEEFNPDMKGVSLTSL